MVRKVKTVVALRATEAKLTATNRKETLTLRARTFVLVVDRWAIVGNAALYRGNWFVSPVRRRASDLKQRAMSKKPVICDNLLRTSSSLSVSVVTYSDIKQKTTDNSILDSEDLSLGGTSPSSIH